MQVGTHEKDGDEYEGFIGEVVGAEHGAFQTIFQVHLLNRSGTWCNVRRFRKNQVFPLTSQQRSYVENIRMYSQDVDDVPAPRHRRSSSMSSVDTYNSDFDGNMVPIFWEEAEKAHHFKKNLKFVKVNAKVAKKNVAKLPAKKSHHSPKSPKRKGKEGRKEPGKDADTSYNSDSLDSTVQRPHAMLHFFLNNINLNADLFPDNDDSMEDEQVLAACLETAETLPFGPGEWQGEVGEGSKGGEEGDDRDANEDYPAHEGDYPTDNDDVGTLQDVFDEFQRREYEFDMMKSP